MTMARSVRPLKFSCSVVRVSFIPSDWAWLKKASVRLCDKRRNSANHSSLASSSEKNIPPEVAPPEAETSLKACNGHARVFMKWGKEAT